MKHEIPLSLDDRQPSCDYFKIAMPVLPASLSITCQTVIFAVSGPSCCYQRLSSAMGAMAAKLMGNENELSILGERQRSPPKRVYAAP
jgi:hypothetical protein